MFHRHKWEVVSSRKVEFYWPMGTMGTTILYRCSCGKVETDTINGWWEFEEIKGKKRS